MNILLRWLCLFGLVFNAFVGLAQNGINGWCRILKKYSLVILGFLLFLTFNSEIYGQVTFIGDPTSGSNFTGDQGGGTPLFSQYVPSGGDIFINWRVYVDGNECNGTGTTGPGQGSSCKVVVRGTSLNTENESLVATESMELTGTYDKDIGNDDQYYANLKDLNLPDGRYSVEIHCDCMGGDYDNNTGNRTAMTTWNYSNPSPYYNGTSGNCSVSDGLESFTDGSGGFRTSNSGNGQLEYFTIGNVGIFRTMIVINDLFLDVDKFQPGNPEIVSDLNTLGTLYDPACVSIGSFPMKTFCPSDNLTLDGAEINTWKNTNNSYNVTDATLKYRVYEVGSTPGTFQDLTINFSDNCNLGGPGGVVFTGGGNGVGGSCQDANGVVDQRWQTSDQNINLLSGLTSGQYKLDFYFEASTTSGTISKGDSNSPYSTTFQYDNTPPEIASCPTTDVDLGIRDNQPTDTDVFNAIGAITDNVEVQDTTITYGVINSNGCNRSQEVTIQIRDVCNLTTTCTFTFVWQGVSPVAVDPNIGVCDGESTIVNLDDYMDAVKDGETGIVSWFVDNPANAGNTALTNTSIPDKDEFDLASDGDLWAVFVNSSGCSDTVDVSTSITGIMAADATISECDADRDGVGVSFTLTDADDTVKNGNTAATVAYYETIADAISEMGPITTITNTSVNQVVYARVEDGTGMCYDISEVTLRTILDGCPASGFPWDESN